jgi:hypothetical protein
MLSNCGLDYQEPLLFYQKTSKSVNPVAFKSADVPYFSSLFPDIHISMQPGLIST